MECQAARLGDSRNRWRHQPSRNPAFQERLLRWSLFRIERHISVDTQGAYEARLFRHSGLPQVLSTETRVALRRWKQPSKYRFHECLDVRFGRSSTVLPGCEGYLPNTPSSIARMVEDPRSGSCSQSELTGLGLAKKVPIPWLSPTRGVGHLRSVGKRETS